MNEKENVYGYIYITTNLINNKKYIGQHKSKTYDKNYYGSGKLLKRAIKKYGKQNFTNDVLEWCYSRDELAEKEKYWIDFFNAVNDELWYNILQGGYGVQLFGNDNPFYGKHHTEETKKKISDSLKGKFAGQNNPMYGVHLIVSDETKQKQSIAHKGKLMGKDNPMYGKPSPMKGKKQSEESRKKNSISHIGKHPNIPYETQEKLKKIRSERMMGEKNPQFGKRGPLSINYGRKQSEETKKKLSDALKGKMMGEQNPSSKTIYVVNSVQSFSCVREVSEYFNLTYGQARYKVEHEIPIYFNNKKYILTRNNKERINNNELS